MTTGRDPKAREALLARNKAMKVALNSEAKLAVLAKQLEFYNNEKIIITIEYFLKLSITLLRFISL